MFDDQKWSRKDLHDIGSLIEGPAIYGNLSAYDLKEKGQPEKSG